MIITLIGSLRDEPAWHEMSKVLTLRGHVVISVAVFPSVMGGREWYTQAEKTVLDLVHLQKIAMADAVMLVTPDYIGLSTARELLWADMMDRPVYLSVDALDAQDPMMSDEIKGMAMTVLKAMGGTL